MADKKAGATALQIVTVGLSDLEEGRRLFKDVMGFEERCAYSLSPSLRAAWRLPQETGARIVELSYRGYDIGKVRLVQFAPGSSTKVRMDHGADPIDKPTDIGPKAIDLYVRPPIQDAMRIMEAQGYKRRSDPVVHHVGGIISEELVYWGPDGVPLLLMVGHVHPKNQQRSPNLPGEFSEVATVSVVSADPATSRAFYRDVLGLHCFEEQESDPAYRDSVSTLTGAPAGSRIHWEMYGNANEPSGKILLLHFFERTGKRLQGRMRPGHLGFSLMTVGHPDLAEVAKQVTQRGFQIVTPPTEVEAGPRHERVMLVQGPNEELFEIVQTS